MAAIFALVLVVKLASAVLIRLLPLIPIPLVLILEWPVVSRCESPRLGLIFFRVAYVLSLLIAVVATYALALLARVTAAPMPIKSDPGKPAWRPASPVRSAFPGHHNPVSREVELDVAGTAFATVTSGPCWALGRPIAARRCAITSESPATHE